LTDVPEVLSASTTRAMSPENGGSKHLWNVDQLLPEYTAQHSRRQTSCSPLWEPEISPRVMLGVCGVSGLN